MSLASSVARVVRRVVTNPRLSIPVVYVERPAKTFVDPAVMGAQHPTPPTEHATRAVPSRARTRQKDDTRTKTREQWYLVAASDIDVVPTGAGLLRVGGKDRKIQEVQEISLSEVVIAYKLKLER